MKINILHISDFHYREDHDNDFKDSVKQLCESMKDTRIDIVVFSGDLVHSVKSKEGINKAFHLLFDPILSSFGIGKERLLIVPGNHDFQTEIEMPAITDHLNLLDSIKGLDEFCADSRQVDFSTEKFQLFNNELLNYFEGEKDWSQEKLFTSSSVEIGGVKIKLLGINSSWRSSLDSNSDRGKLLYPIGILNEAVSDSDAYDFVFCAMHQQPQDFKEFVSTPFEEVIARHCHILFSGHYHKFKVEEIDDEYSGYIHCVAPATFNRYDKSSQYGMCFVSLDVDNQVLEFVPYFKTGASPFMPAKSIKKKLPLSEEKRKAVELSLSLKEIYRAAVRRADDSFLTGHVYDPSSNISFNALFVEPIIRDHSWQDTLIDGKKGQRILTSSIISDPRDFVFFGSNKCGKTSLLYKILLGTYEGIKGLKTIPYYINCKELTKNNDNPTIDIIRILSGDLHLNRRDTQSLFVDTTLLLLLDDFDVSNKALVNQVINQVSVFPKVRVILTVEETLSGAFDSSFIPGHCLEKLYFHTITTNEIHQLTLRWPGLDVVQKKSAEEKMSQIFRQMHIPFNYWTASLFLWILKKTSPENVHNNFDLIEFYVNEILDQRGIVEGRQLDVQYTDFKTFLGELAAFLLHCEKYSAKYQELIDWTNQYRERVLKYTETAENTISWLLKHTVLVSYDGDISFRLKGVFEYFIALNMSKNMDFRDTILADEHYYLSFGNELELLAGFKPEDESLVDAVYKRTLAIFSSLTKDEHYSQVDNRLESKKLIIPGHAEAVKELAELLSSAPPEDVIESISPAIPGVPIDSSRVEIKRWYDVIEPTLDNLEQSLFILSRVFRNSNVCNNQSKSDAILDFILLASCNLGINYADELTRRANTEEESKIVNVVSRLMPLVMEAFLYEALCQNNLGRVLNRKLEEMIASPEGKEFMIFIVAFMLIDLNVGTYSSALDAVDRYIKKGLLRYSAYSKLSLIVFKYTGTSYPLDKVKKLLFKINDEIGLKKRNELEVMIRRENNDKQLQKQINLKDYKE